MKKRISSLVVVCLIIVSALAGCASSQDAVNLSKSAKDLSSITGRIIASMDQFAGQAGEEAEEPELPEAADFRVSVGYERHDHSEDVAKIDIVLPRVSGSSTAEVINDLIEKDLAVQKYMTLDELLDLGVGFAYPWLNVRYEVIDMDGIYSINVFDEYSSFTGSGIVMGVWRYHYDSVEGRYLTDDMYLEKMGMSKADVLAAAGEAMEEYSMDIPITYENFERSYYFNQNGELIIHVSQ